MHINTAALKSATAPRALVGASIRADASPAALFAQLNQAFEGFKAEHSKHIEDLKKGMEDVVRAEKVDRINTEVSALQAAIDDVNVKLAAAVIGAGAPGAPKDPEYTQAFQAHMRKGAIQAALNKGAADEGGYTTPTEWDRTITDKLILISPVRQIARSQTISVAGYSKLYNMRGTASGWVGETTARPETATPEFASLNFTTGEIYAYPAATQQILDDSAVDLETWLAGEVETEFAYQEGKAFVSGDGVNKPKGFLTYTTAPSHPFGAVPTVNGGDAALITSDGIVNLIYDLPQVYTGGARFVMNRKTQGKVRLLKDGQNNYIWQPSFQIGQPATLAGFPVTEIPDMPDVAANAIPIVFGDFNRAYLVIDRIGIRVLRDPYTNKPYVGFYTTKRVGGGIVDPQPLRYFKIAV